MHMENYLMFANIISAKTRKLQNPKNSDYTCTLYMTVESEDCWLAQSLPFTLLAEELFNVVLCYEASLVQPLENILGNPKNAYLK